MSFWDRVLGRSTNDRTTLIAIDWERIRNRIAEIEWIRQMAKARMWIIIRKNTEDDLLHEFKGQFADVEIKVLPENEINTRGYLTCLVVRETAINTYQQIIIVGVENQYDTLVNFLKEHQINVENRSLPDLDHRIKNRRALSVRNSSKTNGDPRSNYRFKEARNYRNQDENIRLSDNNTELSSDQLSESNNRFQSREHKNREFRNDRPSRASRNFNERKSENTASYAPRTSNRYQDSYNSVNSTDNSNNTGDVGNANHNNRFLYASVFPSPEDAQKITELFAQRFAVGESCRKSALGMLVRQATNRTVFEVFNTRNSKLFINTLLKNGNIEDIDSQYYKVNSIPTPESLQRTIPPKSDLRPRNTNRYSNRRRFANSNEVTAENRQQNNNDSVDQAAVAYEEKNNIIIEA